MATSSEPGWYFRPLVHEFPLESSSMDHLWVFAVREWIRHQERKSVPFNQTVDSTMFQMVTEGLRDNKVCPLPRGFFVTA